MTSSRPGKVFRFAGCELDLGARELRRDGSRITTQPKVLELIAYLFERRDRAVGKAELQDALWPGVVVTETSLTQAVRKARRALADDAQEQKIIRTVHGHGYRFVAALDSPGEFESRSDAAGTPPAVAAARPTIAILPFTNLSGSDDQEYFSDAIAQDIISQLSRHRWLNVLSRNMTFGYKRPTAGLRQIALELGADYAVTGSVRRAGERIRVVAELVDARSGSQFWAERYDRRFEDLFEVQDEITGTIVARLEPEIGFAERQRVARSVRADLQAWDTMHLGVAHLFKFTAKDNVEAQRLLQRSRELDPGFGEAHAWWAYAVVLGMVYWDTSPDPGLLEEALAATQQALDIDDQNAVFYALKARVELARGEYDSARRANELAISLNPTLAAAHCGLADTLAYQGRYEEAIDRFETAIRMSPNDPQRWAFLTYGALALIFKHEFESAIAWTDRARVIPNCQYWALAHRAVALAYLDRREEARAAFDAVLGACPGFSLAFAERKLFYLRDRNQLKMYLEGLRMAGAIPA